MPRPRQSVTPQLSQGQAAYVLERLIGERRISQGDINRYVSEMGREISELEQRLQRLREAHGGMSAAAPAARRGPGRPPGSGAGRRPGRPAGRPAARAASAAPAAAAPARGRRRRSSITAEQLASRQLQGRYLALVRQFPERRRAEFARTAKEKGREVAIKDMQAALNK